MTVLLVIAFFATFILIDYLLTRRKAAREAAARTPRAEPVLEPVWVAGYQLPEGLHYHRGHTWARQVDRDTVVVGLDDFARRLVGSARAVRLPAIGDWLHQGGRSFAVRVDGRAAEFLAPVEGEVVAVNPELRQRPQLATDDPYGRGWVLKVRPPTWPRTCATCSPADWPGVGWRTAARPSSCGSWRSRARSSRTAGSRWRTSRNTCPRRSGSGSWASSCSPRRGATTCPPS